MKTLLAIIGIVALAGIAFAGNPPQQDLAVRDTVPCNLQYVAYDWDFAAGGHGFAATTCDPTGGTPVWEWGTSNIAGAPGDVWGTVLTGNYVNDAGDGLLSPAFMVSDNSYMMEVHHWYDIETNYDGGNVSVNGTVIPPMSGYDAVISTSTGFYAFCTDMEDGFTGHAATWMTSCWDLSGYIGSTVEVSFDFGTDSSVSYPGWYLASVKVGTDQATPVEPSTWGSIKSLYQ